MPMYRRTRPVLREVLREHAGALLHVLLVRLRSRRIADALLDGGTSGLLDFAVHLQDA
jgi:hypothetical protein